MLIRNKRLFITTIVLCVVVLARNGYIIQLLTPEKVEIQLPIHDPSMERTHNNQRKTLVVTAAAGNPSQQINTTTTEYTQSTEKSTLAYHDFSIDDCVPPYCLNYLNEFDHTCFDNCPSYSKSPKYERYCKFMNGKNRAPVALVSLPGSGNTWLRELLEKATGICTGSVYCDGYLRTKKFNGESVRSGSVLVVKTHETLFMWTNQSKSSTMNGKCLIARQPEYGAVIFLLRNPYNAIIAERNRQRTGHVGTINIKTYFGNNSQWESLIKNEMTRWKGFFKNIILEAPPQLPVVVVHYEDLMTDRVREVSQILDFLQFPHTHKSLTRRLTEDSSTFRRRTHIEFQVYTEEQENYIENCVKDVLDALRERNNNQIFGIEKYIKFGSSPPS